MKNMFIRTAALAAACIYMGSAAAQEPLRPEAQLRFDEARQEAIADLPSPRFCDRFLGRRASVRL